MSTLSKCYEAAQRLEQALGCPHVESNLFSYRAASVRDESERYPDQPLNFLYESGLQKFYVPVSLGGRLASGEEMLALHRVIASRDLTVNTTFSTQAWSLSAWIAGTEAQQRRIAGRILSGAAPCLGFTEKEHGADLLAGELRAEKVQDGSYVLTGEKWAINRATRGDIVNLVAKTGSDQGPRSLTSFWIDKRDLDVSQYYHLPKLNTLGVRGIDLSGIGFRSARVSADAVLGREGEGLDVALKSLQVTRTFCSSFSLAAGDVLLRMATSFVGGRKIYGGSALAIPLVREQLAQSYVNLLAAECGAVTAARGLHLFPQQFSTWSSVVKIQAPLLVEELASTTASVLGARYLMRDEFMHGMFQKTMRDHMIVNIFDGSRAVCLDSLRLQLRGLVTSLQQTCVLNQADLVTLFDWQAPLQPCQFDRLRLYTREQDAVMMSLPMLARVIEDLQADESLTSVEVMAVQAAARRLLTATRELYQAVLDHMASRPDSADVRMFSFAQQYCNLHSAVSSLGVWYFNRHQLRSGLRGGAWVCALVERLGCAQTDATLLPINARELLVEDLQERVESNSMLALIDFPLATRGSEQQPIHFE